jgi:molybdopterin converting factor subunit 1
VLLFAGLRERFGTAALELDVDDGATVAAVIERLSTRTAGLHSERFATAVNRRYAPRDAPLREGDEVALIPPVSGG